MAAIQGLRGTGEFTTDFRPRNYRELFTLLEPNGNAPLNALLAMGSSEGTDDPEYKNFRDELPDRKMKVDGAVASTSTTTITIDASDDNKFAIAGSIVVNSETGEVMHVTADTTGTTLTVARNIGATSHQIADNAELFIAGFAAAEGANSPTAISFDAVVSNNYCQIFRTAFQVSNTLQSTYLRTGDKLDEAMTKALKLHMSDIERAMFFGMKHEDASTASQPVRFTGGIINSLTNVVDVSTDFASYGGSNAGQMTEAGFDDLLISSVFKYGSKQKIAFVGETVANQLQQIGKDRWQPTQYEGAYGVNLTQYTTFAGDLMVHLHPQFRQVPGMKTAMIIIDFPYLSYRYLEGRDTQLLENRQAPDADSTKHEYLTECGLEMLQDKVHSYIKNWSTR
ncbi:MAG: hypothetical protein CMK23_08310 [Porticoccaceae bacterium]|nr:hypothetical protein [Porticoccaceae bacterium]MAK89597.1 hypothetical protein [Euryarchaeota archaeon]|tara:strand:- start:11944 stop:13131 length:1188 start_codon:yes stop_codon:yes gene_type:complete